MDAYNKYNSFRKYRDSFVANAQSYSAPIGVNEEEEEDEEEKNKGGFFGGLGYFFEKIGLGFMQGIEGIVDYAVGGVAELFDADEFAEDVISTDWMNYNHADEWFNPSEGWKTAGDVAGGVGTSLPGILAGVAVTIASGGTAAAAGVGLVTSGLAAAGTSTKEAFRESGELGGKEFGYGAMMGAVEAGTEALSGAIGAGLGKSIKAVGTTFGKTAGKAASKGVQSLTLKSAAKQAGKEFISEAFEEGFAEIVSPYAKRLTYDPNAKSATVEEVLYAATIGGISGVLMGGARGGFTQVVNNVRGNRTVKQGGEAQVMALAKQMIDDDAGGEYTPAIKQIYERLSPAIESGAELTGEQRRALGELKTYETANIMRGAAARSAIAAVKSADAIAARLNADGRYKMVDGKFTFVEDASTIKKGATVREITAEDITSGYDANGKSSIYKALKSNDVLRYIASADAAGRFMLQATEVENATLRGEQIRNETEYKRLREEASPEARSAMSRELGIDLNTASLDDFNAAVKAYKESGKADAYQAKIKKVEEIKSKKDSKAYAMPRAISLADGGIRHYTDGQSNIAIARDGESFIIYDYDSGKVTRDMTRAEVNAALARYRNGTMNEAAVTSESAAEVKPQNANTSENLSSSAENVQNAAETASENVQGKAESASDIWEKGVTEADRKAATEARKQTAEIDSYAKENIKDYDNLSRANKLMVRDVIRKARESGISEADALSYARVAARTGLDIQFNQKECYKGKNEAGEDAYHAGFYDPENNRIVVNPKTEKKHMVLLIHELSHAMRSYRTKGGEVKYFIDEDTKISKELWDDIKKYYADKKGNVDMGLAYDEASAYYAEALFGTEGAIDLLLGEKPTLRQKILSFFTKSAAYYSTDKKLSREARRHFKKFKAMFDSFALRNTVNNTDVAAVALSDEKTEQEEFSTANMRGEADGAVASNEVTETMVAMASGRRFSMNTEFEALPKQMMSLSTGEGTLLNMIEGLPATEVIGISDRKVNGYSGRAVRQFAMRNNKFNKSEISNVNKFMDEMAKFMEEAGVTYRFIGLNDVKNAKLHYTYDSKGEIKSIVLSAMVKNGDYPVNFDLSSICKKRVAMSTLIRKLAKRGSIDNGTVDLTPSNIFRINRALKNAGYETACLGCFVESKRYNSLKWAETFCAKWNAAVKKINPNATYFNYGSSSFTEDSFTLEQAIKLDEAANKYIKATKTERLANALEKYKAKEAAGQPLIEGKLMKVDGKELNTFSKAARDRIVKSETISEELKNRYLTCDVSTLNMADVEFLLENGILPGAALSNKQAVSEMVKSGEAYQHLLKPSDLLTDSGISKLEALPNFHGVLYGHYGSGTPKLMQSYTPYNSEIALLPTHKNSEQTLAEYLYSIAGVRMQSFSDFQIQNIYDYLQMVADLAARKLPAHAYTKEISFARLLGMTGIKVNLSVMYDIDTTADSAHAGLTKLNKLIHKGEYAVVVLKDEQGEWVYNIGDYQTQKMFAEAFPDDEKRFLQSIGFADAVKLQSTEGYSANCGIIGVGYSDLAIFAMLDDKRIRYIIPYHASSLPADIKIATNIELGTDYTSYQNNMKISEILDKNGNKVAWSVKEAYKRLGSGQAVVNELNEKVRSEGWVVKTTKAQNGHGSYGLYEDLQQTSDPKKTAGNFLDWCAKNGTLPLFYQFASHENYYKLIYDYNVYDCITEKYAPQEAVTNTYPTMQDGSVKAGNVTDGGFNTEYLESAIDKQMAFMDNYNRNLDADLDRLADNMEKGNYSLEQPLDEKFEVGKSARRYSMDIDSEAIPGVRMLTEKDLPSYLRAGGRANKYKSEALAQGKKIILTSSQEVREYIEKAIAGDKDLPVVAYGKVSDRLADDVDVYSKGKINIRDYYLELVADDIRHSHQEHLYAKENGDIDLSTEDFVNIPGYVADYDDFVYVIKYKSGTTKICVSKKNADGRIVLIETVSKSHESIEFKNMIGVSEQKYIEKYAPQNKNGNSTNTGGSVSSNTSPPDETVSEISISQSSPSVKSKSEKNSRRASAEGISNTAADIDASRGSIGEGTEASGAAVGLPRRAARANMTVGQIKKFLANYSKAKTYSRKDAMSIVGKIDASNFLNESTRNEIAESIWQIYNEALTKQEREAAAHDIAQYFALKLFSEAKVENPDAKKAQEDLVYLSAGIGRLTFTTEQMNEIKHRMDKDGANTNSIRGRWGYKVDKKRANGITIGGLPLETFVVDIAREMPGMAYLEEMRPVDAFLEINTIYAATREIALDKEMSAFWDVPESEFGNIVQSIQNDIMQGYIDTGSKSKFASMFESRIEFYQNRAERFKNDFEEIRGRDKINGMLVNQAYKMRDLKIGRFKNATQDQNDIFKKSIETLANVQWRGNISVKKTRKAVSALYEWYTNEDVKKAFFGFVDNKNPGKYNEGIAQIMKELSRDENKTFSKVELYAMLDVMGYFTNFVETFGKVWRNGAWVDAEAEAKRFINIIPSASKKRRGAGNITKKLIDKYVATFSDPAAVIRRMDDYEQGFFTEMFEELREAAINADAAEIDILAAYDEFIKSNKHYLEKAKTEKVKYNGVEIPKIDLISLYMTLKDAHSHAGFAINGFDIRNKDGKTTRVPGGLSATETHSAEEVKGYVLSQMSEIDKLFTDTDREYMKILERGYVKAGEAKAFRDMQKYGFTNVSGNYYYPIMRANIASNVDKNEIQAERDRVSNASFNKDRVKGSKQELFIEDADKLFRRHVHAVCQYANLSPVIDAYNMLYNYDVSGNPDHPTSISTESQNVWTEAHSYFSQLISDVQGISATKGAGAELLAGIRSNYAKFQLGANPKAWFSQLSSLFAASSILDVGKIATSVGISGADVDKYCKLARIRNYDNAAAKAQAVADSKIKSKKDSITDLAMKPIGGVDRFVITRLFAACQAQVEANDNVKVGTEENKVLAGKLLTKVILETQQNSLATEKSAAMRSGNEFYRALTMFRADAMKVVSRVIDSYGEVRSLKQKIKAEKSNTNVDERNANIESLKKRLKTARKKAAKATYSLAMTSIFTALVAQGFKWLYAKERDEDETFVEDFALDTIGNMIGGLPVITDAYNYFVEGFDVENYSYTAVNDFLASAQGIINLFDEDASSQDIARGIKNLTYSLGQLSGVPTRNLYNAFYGLTKRISPTTGYAIDSVFYEKNYKNDYYKAIKNGDEEMADYLLQLLAGERLNDDLGEKTYGTILDLSKEGYKILPKEVPDKITVDGVEYELDELQIDSVKKLYSQYVKEAESFVSSSYYNSLDNESKYEAISYYFDLSRDRAISEALDVDRGRKVELIGLLGEDEITKLHIATKGIESDVDKEGNTVAGSKKTKVLKAIKKLGGSKSQQVLMLYASGYTVQDGDIKGVSASAAKKMLLNAIMKLNVTSAEKAEIAKSFGFTVKNGKIIKDF